MFLIDPHIHCISRTMDDYERLAHSGTVAVSEPAFWAGFDRTSVYSFIDYFRQLTEFEPTRAATFGIQHYTWLCINAKEAENLSLARDVIEVIPQYLDRPNVVGVGEIGLNKNTRNECTIFQEQVELAKKYDQLILIHTPHLQDKYKGTIWILDMLDEAQVDPERVLVDHVEEHTIKPVLDRGYWAGMTLYPVSKMTPNRGADMLETYGHERLCVNAAADWGISDPFNLHRCIVEYRSRGHTQQELVEIFHNNPARFMGQCSRFGVSPIRVESLKPEAAAV